MYVYASDSLENVERTTVVVYIFNSNVEITEKKTVIFWITHKTQIKNMVLLDFIDFYPAMHPSTIEQVLANSKRAV